MRLTNWRAIPIMELDIPLPTRVYSMIGRDVRGLPRPIVTLGDVDDTPDRVLLKMKNIGPITVRGVRAAIDALKRHDDAAAALKGLVIRLGGL
jgi:hypothetical protein